MKRLLLSIAKGFLPLLFVGYITGISLFTHTHIVHGVTIVHSHPYKTGDHHQHKAAELQLIHTFNNILIPDIHISTSLLVPCFILLHILLYSRKNSNPASFAHHATQLRAPPVL